MSTTSRRQFLCVSAGAAGCWSLGLAAWLLRQTEPSSDCQLSPGSPAAVPLQAVTRTSWALGCDVSMTVLHGDRAEAEAALTAAFDELELVEVTKHQEKQFYSAITDVTRQIVEKQGVKGVDATSRATITAEAIINATAGQRSRVGIPGTVHSLRRVF